MTTDQLPLVHTLTAARSALTAAALAEPGGGTFIQIVNGQLMAVMVDDDPESSNNQAGLFGIEIEATTQVSVRNIWVKKFD